MMIKRIMQRISRNKRIRRTLPNGIQIYATPDSQLKYLRPRFDADLVELAREYVNASSVVWDIGANCGVFAFSCAHASQVVAMEPDPFLGNLLQQSVALNGAPVSVVSAAAWSSTGLAEFSIARFGRASNYLTAVGGRDQSGGERYRLWVPTMPLDDLLEHFKPPTFLKIDVEGAEVHLLNGAARVLRTARPVLYLEIGSAEWDDCRVILEQAGYRLEKRVALNWLAEPV